MKVPEILYRAQRQYRHNFGNNDLVVAFEFEETIKVVNKLKRRIKQLESDSVSKKKWEEIGEVEWKLTLIMHADAWQKIITN